MNTKLAIAFTGGIDSTVLAYWLPHIWRSLHGSPPDELRLMVADFEQSTFIKSQDLAVLHGERLREQHAAKSVVYHRVPTDMWKHGNLQGLWEYGFVPDKPNPHRDDYENPTRPNAESFVEGRNNYIFTRLMIECSQLNIPVLYTGYQYESAEWDNLDSYRHRVCDAGPNFTDRMNLMQEVGFQRRVRIENPFITFRMGKADIIKLASQYAINVQEETYSCHYWPECGKCENCQNRTDVLNELSGGTRDA